MIQRVMNLALNNATNVIEYYRAKGEDVDVDCHLWPWPAHAACDTSPYRTHQEFEGCCISEQDPVFRVQQHQRKAWRKKEGTRSMCSPTPSSFVGVVRLMELQEKGWSYLRP